MSKPVDKYLEKLQEEDLQEIDPTLLAISATSAALGISNMAFRLYKDYFNSHPFVEISDHNPDVKQVVNTNKVIINLHQQENMLLIVSVIDNLIKGASGQAVQNMNLMFGLDETTGLKLKPIGY